MAVSTTLQYNNASNLPWVVQKFGGTSVGKFLDNIANHVVKEYVKQNRLVVVCSARSGESKQTGTTNRLIRAANDALKPGSKEYLTILDDLLQDHLKAAADMVQDPVIRSNLEDDIKHDCSKLKSFLEAAQIINEISPRSRDIIIGVGEKLACRIVAAVLQDRDIDAQFVSLENIIDQEFEVLDQKFYDYLAKKMAQAVEQCGSKVPVVTGFFGIVPGSLLSSVGRGYTDLCAALTAVGLGAEELQIWKEVDGIFTADPRKVKTARLLPIITPEEASELTYYGSEVIHPFTMEQVIRSHIPIRIKNVENPRGQGTIIFPTDILNKDGTATPPHSPKVLAENGYSLDLSRKYPTAVTIKDGVIVLNIHSNRKSVSHGFFAKIFSTLDRYGVVVDLISTSEVHVSMALGVDSAEKDLERVIADLRSVGRVDVLKNMAILSLVGKQMKNMVGISGMMFTTLASAGVNIEMISQGASEINISCVIDEVSAVTAINAIHDQLLSKKNKLVLPAVKVALD
ncbi:Aspartate/glutamate/uridylate kinase [Radiomyces spectabilis]|uniref:Aspartate/glutamate/uridylate kinase n=1 Tax=Radiomyces spectabilis TaxID=64574 RepID=UPI00221FA6FF|nr:Aspartate/glutamate/uridylate kinase [Radiomyces spectabilis]KAI8371343.1 Aspartate/glutamate/uridylate kinase [Radiomyces spectabilis]